MRGFIMTAAAVAAACVAIIPAAATQGSSGSGEDIYFPYPKESLERREEGTVGYRVEVDRRGELKTCEVTRSSGFAALDRATCEILIRNGKFRTRTNAEGRKVQYTHDGNIVWKIS